MEMIIEFECPKCEGHVCETWALNGSSLGMRFSYWFDLLCPLSAVSEILFGQRVPRRQYVCKACELPFDERTYFHCPECDSFHESRMFSYLNSFGHWLGLFCPSCGGEIPCHVSFTTRLVSLATAPIWWLPLRVCKAKLIRSQQFRIARAQHKYVVALDVARRKTVNYVQIGFWGAISFDLTMSFICTVVHSDWQHGGWLAFIGEYAQTFLSHLLHCLTVGPVVALVGKFGNEKKGDKKFHLTFDSAGQVVPLKFDDVPGGRNRH